MIQPTTIFLASSSELKPEREAFETRVYRKSKLWRDRGIELNPVIWEDFIDAMSRTRSQDEYNVAIRKADIFVLLVHTKVGKYSAEEFDVAHKQFTATGKPLIYTYFKNVPDPGDKAPGTDYDTVRAFIARLAALQHFPNSFATVEGFLDHFTQQLDKLQHKGFIQGDVAAPAPASAVVHQQVGAGGVAVGRDNNAPIVMGNVTTTEFVGRDKTVITKSGK
jgi:hypothetical protein